jgi:hypothetical protein
MLLLFPGGFWYDIVVYCGLVTSAMALVLVGVGSGYVVRVRWKTRKSTDEMATIH